ncbi:MAG: TlpA family protein disulfide reductase [Flavobacteriaceae bacterium]|nr:TlpA family protein disulfide reductase [Flavobacteriaceae bacterium]
MKKCFLLLFIFSIFFNSQAQIKIGDNLPSFTLKNIINKDVSSETFQNKYYLIDFWASWCAPCRKGNIELVKLYKTIDRSKFEIVGISIDTAIDKWKKAIEKDKIIFTQLIDPKGFDAKTAVLFGVEELPSQFLFDKQGKLIAINPTKAELIKILK